MWRISSRSLTVSFHELGKQLNRQQQLSKSFVIVVYQLLLLRMIVSSFTSEKRQITESVRKRKTFNELLDSEYHFLPWTRSWTMVVYLHNEHYSVSIKAFALEVTEEHWIVRNGFEYSLCAWANLIWLMIQNVCISGDLIVLNLSFQA